MIEHWSNFKKLIYLYIIFNKNNNIITTIKGASPLSIINALAKPIKSLIQYGKITQNGTPTPNALVDIVCNNGAVRMVDDELPSGYKRLIGITFDGSFRYETGEALTGDDDVTMTLDHLASSGKNVFGSYNGANEKNFSLYVYGSTSGSYFRYGDQLKRPKYGSTGQRTITFGKNGTSGFADDSDITPEEFTTPANAYIGMLPNSSSAAYTGDIIGSIPVSNRLKWIPCERQSDGVIGYYEKFNKNFLEPVGSGTPISLGYDTSHLTVLTVVGTPEVLSVETNLYDASTNVVGYYIPNSGTPNENPDPTNSYTAAIPVEVGKKYTFTGVSGKAGSNNKRIIAYSSDAKPNASLKVGAHVAVPVDGIGIPYTVSIDLSDPQYADARYIRFSLNTADTDVACVEEGSGQTASVVNLFAVGDYADTQDIISGVITRRVGIKVLDGTENWIYRSDYNLFSLADIGMKENGTPISSHFPYKSYTTSDAYGVGYIYFNHLFVKNTDCADLASFKAYLTAQYAAGTPVIVIYPLAEEQAEKVDGQSLYTEEGENIINVISDVGAVELETSYYIEKH